MYGFTGEEFVQALQDADVRLLLDIRQRRGVRGSEYAWANAKRLQAALEDAEIAYEHHPELAPTTDLRRLLPAEGAGALFCVERDPEACHRSLVADRLAAEHGLHVEHLRP